MAAIKKKKADREDGGAYGSMQKAFRILEVLAERSPRGVTEISEALGLEKSGVSRLLKTLSTLGYVVQSTDRGQYQLSARVLLLAEQYLGGDRLVNEARPILRDLADRAKASAHVGVIVEDRMVVVAKEASPESIQVSSRVGGRIAPHASALGKVLLAGLPPEQAGPFLRPPLPKFTARTESDPKKVRKFIQEVRRKGFALESGEEHQGVGCIGAPVKDAAGRWIAAMSISGPLQGTPFRLGQRQIALLVEKAEELSRRISSAGDAGHGMFALP